MRVVSGSSFILVFLATLLLAASGAAAQPVRGVGKPAKVAGSAVWAPSAPFATPAKELLAAQLPRSPKEEESEVLYSLVRISIEANMTRTLRVHQIVRVRSQAGVNEWSEASLAFDPWYENRPAIKARVVTADAREHWLNPQTFSEEATSGSEYSSRRRLRAPLPALAPGSVLEVMYERSEHQPFFAEGGRGREWLTASTYTQTMRVVFDIDDRVPFKYQVRGSKLTPKITPTKGRKEYTFEIQHDLPYADWPASPPPDVALAPVVEYGYAKSWQAVAAKYAGEVDRQIGAFDAKSMASAIVGASTDPREKAQKLLAHLNATVRYVALELGERSIVPAPPAQVVQQHFGDCKDKATLLVALLRAVSVPANVALLETGPGLDIARALPGFGTFDHAIVHVGGKDPFWIDPSSGYSEVGILPESDQNRAALIADVATTGLERTPLHSPESNLYREEIEINYPLHGRAAVRETTMTRGPEAITMRADFDATPEQLKQNLAEYARNAYGAEIVSVDPTLVGPEPKLVFLTEPTKSLESSDGAASVAVDPQRLFRQLPRELVKPRQSQDDAEAESKLDPRTKQPPLLPIALIPKTRSVAFDLIAPAGSAWDELPQNLDVTTRALRMQRTVTVNAGKARIEYTLAITEPIVPAADVEKVRQAVLGYLDVAGVTASARYAPSRAIDEGDYAKGIAAHRALVEGKGSGAQALRRFSLDLMRIGLLLPARNLAAKAEATDDKHPWAKALGGDLATVDDLGRRFRPGIDVVRAQKAYERAVQLAPKEVVLRDKYARSLLVAPDGMVFGKNARIAQARDLFLALRKDENTEEYDDIILNTYIFEGKYKDATAFAASLASTSANLRGGWLAAIAATDGVDAMHAKAAQLAGGEVEKQLWSAYGSLVVLGETAVAAKVLQLPVLQKNMTAQQREELGLLANPASCLPKLHPAVREVLAIETAVMRGERTPEASVDKLVSAAGKGYVGAYQLRWHLRDLMPTDGAKRLNTGYEVAQRTCVQKWQVDEQHDTVRVRRFAPGSDRANGTYFLTKHGKAYRLRAVLRSTPAQLAQLIREDLLANRLDAAHQWAAWLRDDIKAVGGKRDDYSIADGVNDAWTSPLKDSKRSTVLWLIAGLYLSGFTGADTSPVTLDKLAQAKRELGEDPRLALAADVAIAAWTRWNKPKEAVALFEALHRSRPYDRHLWRDYITALERADQDELAFAEMEKWVASNPDRDGARLFSMDGAKGRWPAMRERVLERLQQGKTNASELNTIAWRALFEPGVDIAQAVSLAEEAVRMSNRKEVNAMHTLAVLYAEQGRHDAALKTIAEAAGLTREYPVPSWIWYVHGRSAEALGFVQEARTYYERCLQVERASVDPILGTGPAPGSTEQLATLRLKALDAAKRK